jgi:hypothetical protein
MKSFEMMLTDDPPSSPGSKILIREQQSISKTRFLVFNLATTFRISKEVVAWPISAYLYLENC